MRKRRPRITDDRLLTSGPARLTQAMGIGPDHNGDSLLRGGRFWLARDEVTDTMQRGPISQTLRIGMSPGKGDDLPWRFVVPGHPYASRRR
jgi:DNA-3-methyladenine glycosylase